MNLWRPKEPEITVAEFSKMWVDAHRKSQQRYYEYLTDRGSDPCAEMLERDRAHMATVINEAQEYIRAPL